MKRDRENMVSQILPTAGASLALVVAGIGGVLTARPATLIAGYLLMGLAGVAFLLLEKCRHGECDEPSLAATRHRVAWPAAARAGLALGALLNVAGLAVWGRSGNPNLAWGLYAASLVALLISAWTLAGRPFLRLGRPRAEVWVVLALLLLAGGLRLFDLREHPFGLWWDEAYSGLAIKRIISSPSYRPIYEAGAAEEPALFWYVTTPFVLAGGVTPFALRLSPVLGGTLGVLAAYLLAREIGGRRYACVAGSLTALMVWHLNFSRIAFNAIWSVTLDALAAYFFLRALRLASPTSGLLGGLCLGLGLQMYYTSRLLPVVLGLYLISFLVRHGAGCLRSWWQTLLAFGGGAVLAVSPLAPFAVQRPAEFFSRMSNVTIFSQAGSSGPLGPLASSLASYLLMFHAAGDTNGRHNLPGWPVLDPISGALFVVGLMACLARPQRPSALLLVAWVPIMLVGGVFSIDAPNSLRCIDEVTAVALLAALPLTRLWRRWEGILVPRLGRLAAGLPTAALVVTLLSIGALNADRYFNLMKQDPQVLADYSAAETLIARDVASLPAGTRVYLDEAYYEHPTIRLLAPELRQHRRFDFAEVPFREGRDVVVYFAPASVPALTALRQAYPNSALTEAPAPYNLGVLFYAVRVSFGL